MSFSQVSQRVGRAASASVKCITPLHLPVSVPPSPSPKLAPAPPTSGASSQTDVKSQRSSKPTVSATVSVGPNLSASSSSSSNAAAHGSSVAGIVVSGPSSPAPQPTPAQLLAAVSASANASLNAALASSASASANDLALALGSGSGNGLSPAALSAMSSMMSAPVPMSISAALPLPPPATMSSVLRSTVGANNSTAAVASASAAAAAAAAQVNASLSNLSAMKMLFVPYEARHGTPNAMLRRPSALAPRPSVSVPARAFHALAGASSATAAAAVQMQIHSAESGAAQRKSIAAAAGATPTALNKVSTLAALGTAAAMTAAFATASAAAEPITPPPTPMSTDSPRASSSSSSSSSTASPIATPRFSSPTNAGAAMIPHPEKAAKGGEDAVYVSSTGRLPMVLAVADGVGGWGEHGVDSGLFSRAFLAGVEFKLNSMANPLSDVNLPVSLTSEQFVALPLDLIQFGYDHVRSNRILGSSTACVVAVHNGELQARNLGDSGFIVLRSTPMSAATMASAPGSVGSFAEDEPLKVVARSQEQQHAFNFPLQLACAEGPAEEPKDADAYSLKVRPGDVIVVGSDGLFDNLHDAVIIKELIASIAKQKNAASASASASSASAELNTRQIATDLALAAHRVAASRTESTPFAENARRHGHFFAGGKMDDISVVVGIV